jgi:hypothetical protein
MNYTTLTSNTTALTAFKAAIVTSVAAAAKVQEEWVVVKGLRAGSVIADVEINLPSESYSSAQVAAVADAIVGSPDTVFEQLKREFGIAGSINAMLMSSPKDVNAGEDGRSVSLGVGIGLGLGGGLILVAALAMYIIQKKKVATAAVAQGGEAYQLAAGPEAANIVANKGQAAGSTLPVAGLAVGEGEGTSGVVTRGAASEAKASGRGRGKKSAKSPRGDPELLSEGATTQI